jgi:prepilin-type processing-associated H-X9-DG protein
VGGFTYSGRSVAAGYGKLYHEWWVPRMSPSGLYPAVGSGPQNYTPTNALGWPRKSSDTMASLSPIISDFAEVNGSSTSVSQLVPGTFPNGGPAHFFNGGLDSINLGFADGHVELHVQRVIQWQFGGNFNAQQTFY